MSITIDVTTDGRAAFPADTPVLVRFPRTPVLMLVFYVVRKSKPGRFRLSAKLLTLLDITIEVETQDIQDHFILK